MKSIRKKLNSPWLDAFLAFISTIIGLFAGRFLEAIAPPLFAPANLPFIAFLLIVVLFLANMIYSVTLWHSTQDSVASIADRANDLASAVGHSIKTVTYSEGYKELERRIRAAEDRILIFTEYANIFDWESKKPIWDPRRMNSSERKSFYDALHKKLQGEKNNRKFHFVKIVQIPENHKIKEMLPFDSIFSTDCRFIVDVAPGEPEFASLRTVSGRMFSNSIIIIDKSFAHISFDVRNPGDLEIGAPFVMLIDDPNSRALLNLHKLYDRIKEYSVLVSKDDL
jgi:hypothetical protein